MTRLAPRRSMSTPLRGIQSAPTVFIRENAKDTAARLAWKFTTSGLKNTLNENMTSGAPRKSPTALTTTINQPQKTRGRLLVIRTPAARRGVWAREHGAGCQALVVLNNLYVGNPRSQLGFC